MEEQIMKCGKSMHHYWCICFLWNLVAIIISSNDKIKSSCTVGRAADRFLRKIGKLAASP